MLIYLVSFSCSSFLQLVIETDVTKKEKEQVESQGAGIREGAHITGLYLQGARWDKDSGTLTDAQLRQLVFPMPVIHVRAVLAEKADRAESEAYACPVYRTEVRGSTYVFTAHLATSASKPPAKWVLAGTCLLLDVSSVQ